MDTHIQGPVFAKSTAAVISRRGYQFSYSDTFPKSVCTIQASAKSPVLVEFKVAILQAFNAGTTNEINVLTGESVLLMGDSSIDETLEGVQGYTPVLFQANTEILVNYTQSGTPATEGKAILIVTCSGLGIGAELNLQ